MVQHDDASFGIDGDAEHLPEVHVGRVLEEICGGVERNLRHVGVLRRLRVEAHDGLEPGRVDRGDCGRGRTCRTERSFHRSPHSPRVISLLADTGAARLILGGPQVLN
jgi:hypothetical protein